jgi:hypothetical protein
MKRHLCLALLLCACTTSQDPTDEGDQGLTLYVAEPNHLDGSFAEGDLAIQFEVVRTDTSIHVQVTTEAGVELVASTAQADGAQQVRMLGGRYVADMRGRDTVIGVVEQEETEHSGDDLLVAKSEDIEMQQGDEDTFWEYVDSPHAALLPLLSKALADAGLDGQNYPAALSLHMMAAGIVDLTGNDPFEGVSRDVARYTHNSGSGVAFHHHYKNSWYAQCGPSGTCWSWACGDCGDWKGCGGHDADCHFCGNGEGGFFFVPAACTRCAVPVEALSCGGWGHDIYSVSCSHTYSG